MEKRTDLNREGRYSPRAVKIAENSDSRLLNELNELKAQGFSAQDVAIVQMILVVRNLVRSQAVVSYKPFTQWDLNDAILAIKNGMK